MKTQLAASVMVVKPEQMTLRGRRAIAAWLRKTARDFVKLGDQYGPARFHARYWVRKAS